MGLVLAYAEQPGIAEGCAMGLVLAYAEQPGIAERCAMGLVLAYAEQPGIAGGYRRKRKRQVINKQ